MRNLILGFAGTCVAYFGALFVAARGNRISWDAIHSTWYMFATGYAVLACVYVYDYLHGDSSNDK